MEEWVSVSTSSLSALSGHSLCDLRKAGGISSCHALQRLNLYNSEANRMTVKQRMESAISERTFQALSGRYEYL